MTSEFADEALGKIEFTTDMDALKDVDFIVEAVVENIDLKRDLYTALGDLCKHETIFASNLSSLSIGGKYIRCTEDIVGRTWKASLVSGKLPLRSPIKLEEN